MTFDYSDTSPGTPTITADDPTLGSAPSQKETVTSVASQVAFTSAALTLTAGTPGEVTVELEDSSGNPAVSSSAQTIDLTSTSGKRCLLREPVQHDADHERGDRRG